MSPSSSVLALALVAAASGCVFLGPPCDCPPASIPFESGTFTSTGGTSDGLVPEEPFAHGAEPKTLVVDREAGTATITYERAGQSVVEVWTIVGEE